MLFYIKLSEGRCVFKPFDFYALNSGNLPVVRIE